MQQGLGKFLYYAGWVIAFLYTATCTYLLFQAHVPASAWWLPVVVIVFFEYGMVKWLHFHKHNARGVGQHVISFLMAILCTLAIVFSAGLQTATWLLVPVPEWAINILMAALILNIALNLLALVGISLTDPEHLQRLRTLTPQPILVVEAATSHLQLEKQVEAGAEQLELPDEQLEIPFTHNGAAKKTWGGDRRSKRST